VREHYARYLHAEETCKTILSLERLEGFDELMERVEPAIQGLPVPVLILWGHPDPYFGRGELAHLRAMFPDVTVREIEGGGHFTQEDAHETVTRELLAFLR
jgi:pimeloyl-ACP methyl ester carboxylesterase